MVYDSTHNFDIKVRKGKASTTEIKKIVEGKGNKLCFEVRGSYTLTPVSCYKFDQSSFKFNTSASVKEPLFFKPVGFQVSGQVQLKEDDQADKIKLTVTNTKTKSEEVIELEK